MSRMVPCPENIACRALEFDWMRYIQGYFEPCISHVFPEVKIIKLLLLLLF